MNILRGCPSMLSSQPLVCWMGLLLSGMASFLTTDLHAYDGPQVTRMFPAGGQAGKTHSVTLSGTFPTWPPQFWIDAPGIDCKFGEANKLELSIADDAKPGLRQLRFFDAKGASSLVPFLVGQCEDRLEVEPNNAHWEAQSIDRLPMAVHGVLEKSGDVDTFQVALPKGATLVASVDAQRWLGSPMDAGLQVVNPQGIVLAQNLDHHGLDPQLIFPVSKEGVYLVRVFAFPEAPDSTIAFAGGERFVYRLTLSTSGLIEHVVPRAISSARENSMRIFGPNLPADGEPLVLPPIAVANPSANANSNPNSRSIFTISSSKALGFVELPIWNEPVGIEVEPNDLEHAQRLDGTTCVTGWIDAKGDKDVYQWSGEAGKRWRVQIDAKSLDSQLDAVLTVLDSNGKQIAKQDDVGEVRDPAISFVVPADGIVKCIVEDLHRQGGGRYWYRMSVEPEQPDAQLTIASDVLVGKVGEPLEVAITISRTLDFAGELKIGMENLPPGVVCQEVSSVAGADSAKSVKLIVQGSQAVSMPIGLLARSEALHGGTRTVQRVNSKQDQLWLVIAP